MEKLLTEYLTNINPMIVFFSFIILVLICWIIVKNRKVISELFNDLYNRKRNKEEILQTIKDNQSDIKTIMENRIQDREQSFAIQKELTDAQNKLSNKQSELSNLISETIKSGILRDQQIASLMLANRELLAEKINDKYKFYISIKGIPEDEVDEFTNLHTAYKGCGGNHSGDAKYEYVIEHLPVIPVETKLIFGKEEK
jgi:predicted CopG family antitoxin